MKIMSLAAVGAAALLTLSACGNGSYGSGQPASGSAGGGTGVKVAQTSLGKVLVDGQGMTLYTLSPAVAPAKAAKLSVTTGRTATPDGTTTTTVAGRPVYTFSQDQQPGDVNGEGVQEFGGTWYAVSPTAATATESSEYSRRDGRLGRS
jgi:predicted lipoprotein with Yx(FWY)xxD motif